MKAISLEQTQIAGAMATFDGAAPFQRASLVLRQSGDRLLRVLRYTDDEAEGEELGEAEWQALLVAHEAMTLTITVPPRKGAWVWVIRQHFALRRDAITRELDARHAIIGAPCSKSKSTAYVVVEVALGGLRLAWVDEATRLARDALRAGDTASALRAAETAFDLDSRMTPHGVALLACAYRRSGNEKRAQGYLPMAERSMGAAFARQVGEELIELNREILPRHPFKQTRGAALRNSLLMRGAS